VTGQTTPLARNDSPGFCYRLRAIWKLIAGVRPGRCVRVSEPFPI